MKGKIILLLCVLVAFSLNFAITDEHDRNRTEKLSEWTDPVNISNSPVHSWGPVVAADGEGRAFVAWVEETFATRIFFSTNVSGSWIKPINVSGYFKIKEGPIPSIYVDKDGVAHIVFAAISGTYEIFYNYYKNGKLKGNLNITETRRGGSMYQSIYGDRNNGFIYVVWQDDENAPEGSLGYWEIMLVYKDPNKTHWSYIDIIPTISNRVYTPEISIDGKGAAHLVWINRSLINNSIVWYAYNPDPTDVSQWSTPIPISEGTGIDFCWPEIDTDNNGNAYVVWENICEGNKDIFFRKRINGEWGDIINLSKTPDTSEQATIAVDKETGDIYVAWAEKKGVKNWDVYLRTYENGKWSEPINMTNNPSTSGNPSLWVDEQGGVHLVYADNYKGPCEILYRYRPSKRRILPPVNLKLTTKINKTLFYSEKINYLTWEKNPENEKNEFIQVTRYSVYRKEVGQDDSKYVEIFTTSDANTFEYEDRYLPIDKKYVYAVTAWDQRNKESEKSEPVSEE